MTLQIAGNISAGLPVLSKEVHMVDVSGRSSYSPTRFAPLFPTDTWVVEGPEASYCFVRVGVGNELLHLLRVNGVD